MRLERTLLLTGLVGAGLVPIQLPAPARAQPLPLGPSFEVHPTTPFHESYQDVARSPTGEFVVVWERAVDAPPEQSAIFARRFARSGDPLGPEFVVDGLPSTYYPAYAAVAMGPAGQFLVVWQRHSSTVEGDSWARAFHPSGDPVGPAFVVHPPNPGNQIGPDVAPDTDGTFLVVWSYRTPGGSPYGARGRRFASDGSALGPAFQVVEPDRAGTYVALARESVGRFVVAYHGPAELGDYPGVFARAFSSDGSLEPEFVVDDTPSYRGPWAPTISADPLGGRVVAWTDEHFHSSSPRVRRFDRFGTFVVELEFPPSSQYPTADFAPDGTLTTTWRESGDVRRGRLYSPGGVPIGEDFDVSGEQWGIGEVDVAFDSDSNPVFTGLTYADSTSAEIRARLFLSGALFIDGFELGDSSAWSSTYP